MIYRVCEHYDDNQPIPRTTDNSECFICYEIKSTNDLEPIYLQNQQFYLKNCGCDGIIHIECLTLWFNNNKTCPICRKNMIKNDNASSVMFYCVPYGVYIHSYFNNFSLKLLSLKVLRFLSIFLFFYSCIDLYFSIIKNKYRQSEYHDSFNKYNISQNL